MDQIQKPAFQFLQITFLMDRIQKPAFKFL